MRYRLGIILLAIILDPPAGADADTPPSPPQPKAEQVSKDGKTPEQQLNQFQKDLEALRTQEAALQKDGEVDRLRKQVDLQRKQMEVLQKMIQLLAEQMTKGREVAAAVEKLQNQAAALEAKGQQAAQRDQELTGATDDARETADAERRRGPLLPATLRELFLPTRTNESPLAIYGTLAADFQDFQAANGNFPSPVFSPHFYLLLNEQFLLEANPEFREDRVSLESAQLDWFVHDNLTLVVGRFYSPLGFFNERLHTSWVFKTPDRPLMFQQVFPSPLSFDGLQARGAVVVGDWPVKLEYAALVGNGLSLNVAGPTARDVADLRRMKDSFDDVNNSKAVGGRLGLSLPRAGLIAGISGLANGAYDRAGQHDLNIWDVDASWHRGNWDLRFEYAQAHQQSPFSPIRRRGLYAQVAFRPYDSDLPLLQRTEGVFRFDCVRFDGINLAATGLDFGARDRIPIDRHRYAVGLNFYLYESLIVKLAYEINDELGAPEIRDNGFLAQLAWGW